MTRRTRRSFGIPSACLALSRDPPSPAAAAFGITVCCAGGNRSTDSSALDAILDAVTKTSDHAINRIVKHATRTLVRHRDVVHHVYDCRNACEAGRDRGRAARYRAGISTVVDVHDVWPFGTKRLVEATDIPRHAELAERQERDASADHPCRARCATACERLLEIGGIREAEARCPDSRAYLRAQAGLVVTSRAVREGRLDIRAREGGFDVKEKDNLATAEPVTVGVVMDAHGGPQLQASGRSTKWVRCAGRGDGRL
jgi:hypothetical protein